MGLENILKKVERGNDKRGMHFKILLRSEGSKVPLSQSTQSRPWKKGKILFCRGTSRLHMGERSSVSCLSSMLVVHAFPPCLTLLHGRLAEVTAKGLGFLEVADGRVSRLHCMIHSDAVVGMPLLTKLTSPAVVEDQSANGTFLNGDPCFRISKGFPGVRTSFARGTLAWKLGQFLEWLKAGLGGEGEGGGGG